MVELIVPIISIIIAISLIVIGKEVVKRKFSRLHGYQKLFGILYIVIGLGEAAYLGIRFGIFEFALELITSVGVGMVILGIALQHQLKNIISGIGLFFNKEIDVGDIITIGEERGTIIELHMTKTVALTDDGERIIIPNQKFSEDVVKILHKQRRL